MSGCLLAGGSNEYVFISVSIVLRMESMQDNTQDNGHDI